MRAVAIGDARRLAGYALAGAVVLDEPTEGALADAGLLVLTPEAYAELAARLAERDDLVWVVLPE